MIKQCVCSMCGKEFNYDDYGYDFEAECFKHEIIEHLKGDIKCKEIIEDAINDLNQKYKTDYKISEYDFNPYYSDYGLGENQISMSFILNLKSKNKQIMIEKQFENETINLTKEDVIKEVNPYYMEDIEEKYIGVVNFEDWCGGHGADDYVINGMYVRDIMSRLKGKKIEIRIIDKK